MLGSHAALGPTSKRVKTQGFSLRLLRGHRSNIRCAAEDQSDDKAAGDSFAQTKRYQGNYQLAESASLAQHFAFGRFRVSAYCTRLRWHLPVPGQPSSASSEFGTSHVPLSVRTQKSSKFMQARVCSPLHSCWRTVGVSWAR